jgi:hypothetical protein
MSQDREKYLYFTVGFLKNSSTMDALWQDALKYHMIDQPGKLIALRMTEYYEMIAQGGLHPGTNMLMAATLKALSNGSYLDNNGGMMTASSSDLNSASSTSDYSSDNDTIVAASPDAEQNADEAAEYWARL